MDLLVQRNLDIYRRILVRNQLDKEVDEIIRQSYLDGDALNIKNLLELLWLNDS